MKRRVASRPQLRRTERVMSSTQQSKNRLKKGIANDVTELIGNTPLVYLNSVTKNCKARIAAKMESMEPCKSVKDRIGIHMILDAEARGTIKRGETILVEPTSGNTGIGLACVSAVRGYELFLSMSETMSMERRIVLLGLGAKLILTDPEKGFEGVESKAIEVATRHNGVILYQFKNPANPDIHRRTTGPEIWEDTDGSVDIFVAGIGTAGTITGTGEYLKSRNPAIRIVAVEPTESAVISGKPKGRHRIQGIGTGLIPPLLNKDLCDEIVTASTEESVEMALRLAREEGLLCGISAGAAVQAALKVGSRPENEGKLIVVLIPSNGERYLSTLLFEELKAECQQMKVDDLPI